MKGPSRFLQKSLVDSEKLPYVLKHPAGLFIREAYSRTCLFWKRVHVLIFGDISKNGSPGQSNMLTRSTSIFCVEPRSPFSNISHHDPKTLGNPVIIVSWPECRPESPSHGDNGDGVQRTLAIWRDPSPPRTGSKYPVQGIPQFDELGVEKSISGCYGLCRSEGFPARDICFQGVILPRHDQVERVLGKPPSPSSP